MTAFFPSMAAFRGKFINFLIKRKFFLNPYVGMNKLENFIFE